MPTSRVFTTAKIKIQEETEKFIAALEAAIKVLRVSRRTPNMEYVTEPNEISKMLSNRKNKT